MCLDQLAHKDSIVSLCKKDAEGRCVGYKIVRLYESGLISPMIHDDIAPEWNDKCTTSLLQPVYEPKHADYSEEEKVTYPLGYHIYALEEHAQFVLKKIQDELRYQNQFIRSNKLVIIPVYFNPQDVLVEGYEDFLCPYHPLKNVTYNLRPIQKVIVLKKYFVPKDDYYKTVQYYFKDEMLVSNLK